MQGFKSAGVFPLNSDIFTEEAFLPSTVFKPSQPPANFTNRSITNEEEHIHEDTLEQPDGDEASTSALPGDIMPLPRLEIASETGRKRKLGSARVLTSTTEKERLLVLSSEKKKKATEPKGKETTKPPTKMRIVEENIIDSEPEDEGSLHGNDSSDTLNTSTTDMHTHLGFDGDKLVAEHSANSYHYVAEVIDKDDPEFVVSFFRQSRKFVKPATDDIANIDRDGVGMCLSAPNATGGTKRAQ